MINFHTITLEAYDLYDSDTGLPKSEVLHNPIEILFDREGEARNINFQEGDSVDVVLTDGTQYLILYENDQWTCCQLVDKKPGKEDGMNSADLVTVFGPYEIIEEALNDLVAKRNYLTRN